MDDLVTHPFVPVADETRSVDANGFCSTCHEVATAWSKLLDKQKAENARLRAAMHHVIEDSPGTPDSVKKYLLREAEGSWGEPYERARLA